MTDSNYVTFLIIKRFASEETDMAGKEYQQNKKNKSVSQIHSLGKNQKKAKSLYKNLNRKPQLECKLYEPSGIILLTLYPMYLIECFAYIDTQKTRINNYQKDELKNDMRVKNIYIIKDDNSSLSVYFQLLMFSFLYFINVYYILLTFLCSF